METLRLMTILAAVAFMPFCASAYDKVSSVLTKEEQKEIVDAHNKWRNQVQPPNPVEMAQIKWDDGLASIAQGWAEECSMLHPDDPDWKKDVINPDGKPYGRTGQNIYMGGGSLDFSAVVDMWDEEKNDYNLCKHECKEGKQCGHYTQVVWATTTHVGCGKKVCGNSAVVVCDYWPAGNYRGSPPYKLSESDMTCSAKAAGGGSGTALKIIIPSVVGAIVIAATITTLVLVLT